MSISYEKTVWKAGEQGNTPINPTNLNNIENGIEQATNQINANTKAIEEIEVGGDYDNLDNIPITNVEEDTFRVWGAKSGTYRLKKGCVLYYAGATSTNSLTMTCDTLLFVDADTTATNTHFYFYRTYNNGRYLYNGYSTSTTGTYNTFNLGASYLTSISSYVKNDLNYSTSSTTYALSAYQGYLLNQNKVPTTRTVNGKALSADVTLALGDIAEYYEEITDSEGYNVSHFNADYTTVEGILKTNELYIVDNISEKENYSGFKITPVDISSPGNVFYVSENNFSVSVPDDATGNVVLRNRGEKGILFNTMYKGANTANSGSEIKFKQSGASAYTAVGIADISGVGDGTILGAIKELSEGGGGGGTTYVHYTETATSANISADTISFKQTSASAATNLGGVSISNIGDGTILGAINDINYRLGQIHDGEGVAF